jgi:RHS repeat-associated protein
VTSYAYDALNRLLEVVQPGAHTLTYAYDAIGNRSGLTYPAGQAITYTYDALNRMSRVIDWATQGVTYTYDAASQLQVTANANGTAASYSYDLAGRVTAITHTSAVSGTLAYFRYTYDNVGNRLSEISTDGTVTYTYDALYRLTGAGYPGGERVTYAYDAMGNRTTMTSTLNGTIAYAYDAADRLLSAGSDSFGWDANGRIITRTFGASTANYGFDPLDRLTQVVTGTITVAFSYNGDGARLGQTVNGTATAYVQDLGTALPMVLMETTGGQDTLYLYGLDLLAQVQPGGSRRYYHADALGSVRALSNGTGQGVASYTYDAFGTIRSQSDGAGNPFTFTGQQLDGETGLVFLRARYYEPGTGRFVSRDILPGAIGRPTSLNRFVYCENEPVGRTDPSGQMGFPSALGWLNKIVAWGAGESSLLNVSTGIKTVGTAAGEMGYEEVAQGAQFVGAVAKGETTANELQGIWREPSGKEVAAYLAREYNTTPDDPTLQYWMTMGGDVEYARAKMPGQIIQTVDTVFESVPVFGEGYQLAKLPQRLGKIWGRIFGSSRSQNSIVEMYSGPDRQIDWSLYLQYGYTWTGGSLVLGPPSGGK